MLLSGSDTITTPACHPLLPAAVAAWNSISQQRLVLGTTGNMRILSALVGEGLQRHKQVSATPHECR